MIASSGQLTRTLRITGGKPCREQNPYLVKAYERYSGKGFEIIGVSLDRKGDRQRWLDAIKHDRLAWTQVSDLNYFNNAVAVLYGVKVIPRNFLIDPKGKIVAKDLRDGALNKALSVALTQ
ncbi:MAG: TlpA family protein disulfide reductase [Flavisolibacter sp.]|nr:TlpA family protein disulfide reductase [Flavisolibacter sp.]MBD0350292.1 TlpA family protein disulfide reductase [Flavisolibacter sp.]